MKRGTKILGHVGLYKQIDGRILAVAYPPTGQKERLFHSVDDAKKWQRSHKSLTWKQEYTVDDLLSVLENPESTNAWIRSYSPKRELARPRNLASLMMYVLPEKACLADWRNQRRYWLRIVDFFGDRSIDSFTALDFRKYREYLRNKGLTTATRNRHIEPCVLLLKLASRCGWINHLPLIKMESERNRKVMKFGLDDFLKMMEHLPVAPFTYRAMVASAVNLGLRLGDLRQLKWPDIVGNRVLVKSSKTDATGTLIPLWKMTITELSKLSRNTAFIFESHRNPGQPYGKINGTIATACRRAGVPRMTTHNLRNLAISVWQYHLGDAAKTARLLGTTVENVIRYSMAEYWARAATPEIDATIHSLQTMTTPHDHNGLKYRQTENQSLKSFGLLNLRSLG